MINKSEMLKLAEELEALADNTLYGKSIVELYKDLRKEAEQKIDVNEINELLDNMLSQIGA